MKTFIFKYKLHIAGTVVGALLGFLYWNFIGCTGESCSITSVWHNSSAYGAIMGFLLAGLFEKPQKTKKDEDQK